MAVKITPPKLPNSLIPCHELELSEELDIAQRSLSNMTLTFDNDVDYLAIDTTSWERVTMSNQHIRTLECKDSLFISCDFSNTEWLESSFHRVVFKNCKFTGTNFAESHIENCEFINCTLAYSSFNFTRFKRVLFQDSQLIDTEFCDVTWQHLLFDSCLLDRSSWLNTPLKGLNWMTCSFETLLFSPDLMSGLTVNTEQAITLALSLGLLIDEPLISS